MYQQHMLLKLRKPILKYTLKSILSIGFSLLNISNYRSVLKYLSLYGKLHTGQCKRTGGCYNKLVVAYLSTGGGEKGKKIYIC